MKNIVFDNNIPIYIQLVELLKRYIISGVFKPGERLLSVRDLAITLKVNPNTVQKALIDLESIGLIYTERTNGKFVTKDTKLISKYKEDMAKEITDNYFKDMKSLGFEEKNIIEYIKGDKK